MARSARTGQWHSSCRGPVLGCAPRRTSVLQGRCKCLEHDGQDARGFSVRRENRGRRETETFNGERPRGIVPGGGPFWVQGIPGLHHGQDGANRAELELRLKGESTEQGEEADRIDVGEARLPESCPVLRAPKLTFVGVSEDEIRKKKEERDGEVDIGKKNPQRTGEGEVSRVPEPVKTDDVERSEEPDSGKSRKCAAPLQSAGPGREFIRWSAEQSNSR